MGAFYTQFLRESSRSSNGRPPDLALGIFGKHPGWDDHIEDIGMETDSLIQAKQLLYVHGIGRQIDSGAWEKPPKEHVLSRFNHICLWQRSGYFLVGRFWSSEDGKGRARYPMVACFHCMGAPLDWMLPQTLPALEKIQLLCQATRSADEVKRIVTQIRGDVLREMTSQPWLTSKSNRLQEESVRFLSRPEWNSNLEGLLRILHQFQHQISVYEEAQRLGTDESLIKSLQIRVPLAADSSIQSLLIWSQFFLLQMPKDLPLLILAPLGESWIDVTVGEPASEDFFCLRATPSVLPLASSIPYHFEPDLMLKSQTIFESMRQGIKPWLSSASSGRPIQRFSSLLTDRARQFFDRFRLRKT